MISDVTSIDLLPYATTGTYRLHTGGGGASVADNVEILWDWKADIYVTTVPEPETYALVLTGLGIMGWMVRRKKRKLVTV